jgi:hypothetical protein
MTASMRHTLLFLFLATLLARAVTACTLQHGGYLDAFYYYHLAVNMAEGRGLTESVIWNYLDNPQSLPRPGNLYWMPLTNIIAWLGIATGGALLDPWRAAQAPFVLLSSLLSPLAAWISWREWRRVDWALQTGLLVLFSGVYFVYWVVTDNFTPFALAVALAFLAIWRAQVERRALWWAVAGLGAGLSHLARVDGVLLVPLIALLVTLHARSLPRNARLLAFVRDGAAAALGYISLMGPWWLRNLWVAGTPFPGGGLQTLWLREYDQLFSYQADLTLNSYLAWGAGPILQSKLASLFWSAMILLGAAQLFLAPFILIMLPVAARRPLFRPFLLYALLLLAMMPLLFTFPAIRGSLFHSVAALVPWMMALAPPGVDRAVRWVATRRHGWNASHATRIFGGASVALAALLTLYVYASALWIPPAPGALQPLWNDRTRLYEEAEAWLLREGATLDERLFAIDPAAYYVATRRPSLVIPIEGPETLALAAGEWDTRWLLLDRDRPAPYREMYEDQLALAGWRPVATFTDPLGDPAILYRYEP